MLVVVALWVFSATVMTNLKLLWSKANADNRKTRMSFPVYRTCLWNLSPILQLDFVLVVLVFRRTQVTPPTVCEPLMELLLNCPRKRVGKFDEGGAKKDLRCRCALWNCWAVRYTGKSIHHTVPPADRFNVTGPHSVFLSTRDGEFLVNQSCKTTLSWSCEAFTWQLYLTFRLSDDTDDDIQ